MERSRAVTGATMAPHGGGANAIGANVQAILCMKLSPDKVETSTLPLP
jgi:hypothetical protein